ncbi:MAG TPA: hypothetical protein VHL11_12100 [Phototrophicaceae bacterium]|jgi:hypothetical protein|nr:hypothetical protein [Phototrophicaceae bacterium]
MKLEPRWEDTKLDKNLFFKPEAINFWLQYDPQSFLQVITHEIREITLRTEHRLDLIQDVHVEIVEISEDIKQDVKRQAAVTIRTCQEQLYDIAATMWSYSTNQNFNFPDEAE